MYKNFLIRVNIQLCVYIKPSIKQILHCFDLALSLGRFSLRRLNCTVHCHSSRNVIWYVFVSYGTRVVKNDMQFINNQLALKRVVHTLKEIQDRSYCEWLLSHAFCFKVITVLKSVVF